jgi:hypothetical protein
MCTATQIFRMYFIMRFVPREPLSSLWRLEGIELPGGSEQPVGREEYISAKEDVVAKILGVLLCTYDMRHRCSGESAVRLCAKSLL